MRLERWMRPWARFARLIDAGRADATMLARTLAGDGPSPVIRSGLRAPVTWDAPTQSAALRERAGATFTCGAGSVRVVPGGVDAALRASRGPAALNVVVDGASNACTAARGESVLAAAERAGLVMPSSCRAGGCGACRVRLIAGQVSLPATHCLSDAELAAGEVLTCCASAEGAVTIEVLA